VEHRKRLIALDSPLSGFAIFFRRNIGKGSLLWAVLYQIAQSFEEDYITQAVPKDRLFIPD